MLWAWGPHAVAETLEGTCPWQTHVERAQGAPRRGGLESLCPTMSGHGGPPRQGMVLGEVTLPRLSGLGVFSNGPRQRIVERGARIFLVEVDGAELSLGAKSCLQKVARRG